LTFAITTDFCMIGRRTTAARKLAFGSGNVKVTFIGSGEAAVTPLNRRA
jgi:hypothetical protein